MDGTNDIEMVRCRVCGNDYPPDRMKQSRGLPTRICKSCEHSRVRAYYAAHPDKKRAVNARSNAKMKETGYKRQWLERKKQDPEWVARQRERERARRERMGMQIRDESVPLTPSSTTFLVKRYSRSLMRRAVAQGVLVREPCEVCGEPETDGHHRDYMKPLDVQWLCAQHHVEAHWNDPEWVAREIAKHRSLEAN